MEMPQSEIELSRFIITENRLYQILLEISLNEKRATCPRKEQNLNRENPFTVI
jgi:hypothetical protein